VWVKVYRSGVDFTKSRKCDFQAFDGLKFTLTTDLRLTIFCEINHWPPFYDFIKLAAGILMHSNYLTHWATQALCTKSILVLILLIQSRMLDHNISDLLILLYSDTLYHPPQHTSHPEHIMAHKTWIVNVISFTDRCAD
jgi:hypothetical protein